MLLKNGNPFCLLSLGFVLLGGFFIFSKFSGVGSIFKRLIGIIFVHL